VEEAELNAIRGWKMGEKELRPVGDRSVELGFDFCFQQKSYPRVGRGLRGQAEGCKNAKIG
jgi:hypothetical protein